MEKVQWKVEGMTCANCALTINQYLQKLGAKDIAVNPFDGDVSFRLNGNSNPEKAAKGVEALGYRVASPDRKTTIHKSFLSTNLQRFWFCFPFTLILMLHMLPGVHIHWLMNPLVQLALTFPVFVVGMRHFGRSAIKSIRNGVPNMNVLIAIGATSAFIYSLTGTILNLGKGYLFYETAVTCALAVPSSTRLPPIRFCFFVL